MHPVFGKCPVCGEQLLVTRLDCRACGTEINGQFSIGRLARLSAEEITFLEIFVKNRGNAYKVGEELGLPYSTIRSRLTDLILAMGYEPGVEPKDDSSISIPPEKRRSILEALSRGRLSADEAIRLLQGEV